jgi:hypothetical protein
VTVVEWLIRKQAELGVSDRRFAALLGLSPSMWHRVRHGERGPSLLLVRLATERFPESRDVILSHALAKAS